MILRSPFRSVSRAVLLLPALAITLWTAPRAIADGPPPPAIAPAQAAKSGLTLAYSENFNGPDGKNLGVGWTQAAHYGFVNEHILHHRLCFEIPSGHDIPWGSATLDL